MSLIHTLLSSLFPLRIDEKNPLVVLSSGGQPVIDLTWGDTRSAEHFGQMIVLACNNTWSNKANETDEDRLKRFEEQAAPLLRAGYNQAIQELVIWTHCHREIHPVDLYNKLQEMGTTRKESISELIKQEFTES